MLLPTQQASGIAALTLVQSALDDIDERRAEETEKLNGKKEDKILKARIASDDVSKAANAKINEHFFGSLKSDQDPMAVIVAKFATAMDMKQGDDESDASFGTRLEDTIFLANFVTKTDGDGKPMLVGPKTFRVSIEQLTATLDGTAENPSQNAQFLARFVTKNGLEQSTDEDNGAYYERLKTALTQARSDMPASVAEVEKAVGLRDLGLTAKQMIAAMKQPYGADAEAVKTALDEKTADENTTTADMQKVVQRLEDVADPKSLEELQIEKTEGPKDPTQVEDAETRAEREQDIRARETAEKLDDVKDINDAVTECNDKATADGKPAAGTSEDGEAAVSLDTLQVLAAGAEMAETEAASDSNDGETGAGTTDTGETSYVTGQRLSEDDQVALLAKAASDPDKGALVATSDNILAIQVDENGIYDFLKRQLAA